MFLPVQLWILDKSGIAVLTPIAALDASGSAVPALEAAMFYREWRWLMVLVVLIPLIGYFLAIVLPRFLR